MSHEMQAPSAQDGPGTDAQHSWIQEHHTTGQGMGTMAAV